MNRYFRADPQRRSAFPIAEPGYPLIAAAAFVTLIFALIDFVALALVGTAATLFICFFFRDPDRMTPDEAGALVAPADGKVVSTGVVEENPFVEGPCLKVGIFMNIFNVHVNRAPCAGKAEQIRYAPGTFKPADREAASTQNEYNAVVLKTLQKQTIAVVQIAGLVARRILCWIKEKDELEAGQRFGLICFGSRVDLYLPTDTKLAVRIGEKVKAGHTIVGYLP